MLIREGDDMAGEWILTDDLKLWLGQRIGEQNIEGMGTHFIPSIIWSLGGEISLANGDVEKMPPRYSLGWIRKEDLESFIAIKEDRFGFIAFRPSHTDQSASLRILDLIDGTIVAR